MSWDSLRVRMGFPQYRRPVERVKPVKIERTPPIEIAMGRVVSIGRAQAATDPRARQEDSYRYLDITPSPALKEHWATLQL